MTRDIMENVPSDWAYPGKWQVTLKLLVAEAWKKAKNDGCASVDEFGRRLQQQDNPWPLSYSDFTKFMALRLSSSHWRRGFAQQTKWGTGDHVRKQKVIPSTYQEFFNAISGSNVVAILTTNYDLVIEKILGPTASGRMGGFNYGTANERLIKRHHLSSQWGYGPVDITGRVPLLKLHGSLNWVADENRIIKYIDARPSRSRQTDALIVPPTESRAKHLLSPLLAQAANALRQADVWIFCGYSVPDYDDDVRELIRTSAVVGQRVVVFDVNPSAVGTRLNDVLSAPQLVPGPPLTQALKSGYVRSAIAKVIKLAPGRSV